MKLTPKEHALLTEFLDAFNRNAPDYDGKMPRHLKGLADRMKRALLEAQIERKTSNG